MDLVGIFGRGWRWRLEGVEVWEGTRFVGAIPGPLLEAVAQLLAVLTPGGDGMARSAGAQDPIVKSNLVSDKVTWGGATPLTLPDRPPMLPPSPPRLRAVNGRRLRGWS